MRRFSFLAERAVFLAIVLLTLTAPPLYAQGGSVLKVETHLIDTTVSVHDSAGALVQDLSKDDLAIFEDGQPQAIRFFSRAEQLPLSIGLVIDVSGSQEKFIRQHEHDIEEFLRSTLLPADRVFAVCFGNHIRLVSDWTTDPQQVLASLRAFDKGDRKSPELGPIEDRDLGTALNDAVFFSATEKMSALPRSRKVLVVFSDGEENSSEHDLLDVIEAAQNNDVMVYAIRYTELKHGRMSARDHYGVRELDHLTAQTGGKSYDAHAMNVGAAFAEISGELRSLYAVAYQSTNKARDGAFRKVVIQPVRPGLVLRYRAGYYAR